MDGHRLKLFIEDPDEEVRLIAQLGDFLSPKIFAFCEENDLPICVIPLTNALLIRYCCLKEIAELDIPPEVKIAQYEMSIACLKDTSEELQEEVKAIKTIYGI